MSDIYISVNEERVIPGKFGNMPEVRRSAYIHREKGKEYFRGYGGWDKPFGISESSVFRLVRMQDQLAGEGK